MSNPLEERVARAIERDGNEYVAAHYADGSGGWADVPNEVFARAAIAACGVEQLRAEVAAYKEGERLAMERMRVGVAERDATIARLAAGVADLVAALKVARGWVDLAAVSAIADGNEAGRCRALDNIDAALAKAKGGEM